MSIQNVIDLNMKAGPKKIKGNEKDFTNSQYEMQRKASLGIDPSFDEHAEFRELNQRAVEVMAEYRRLQSLINELDSDFDKDEEILMKELKEAETRNRESIKRYKEVKERAVQVKESIEKVINYE